MCMYICIYIYICTYIYIYVYKYICIYIGNWQSLEDFLEGDILESKHDVELNNNASFYRAILAVHKENYSLAMSLIHETRFVN
jgi:hypothetical protein